MFNALVWQLASVSCGHNVNYIVRYFVQERIANSKEPRTPVLKCPLSQVWILNLIGRGLGLMALRHACRCFERT